MNIQSNQISEWLKCFDLQNSNELNLGNKSFVIIIKVICHFDICVYNIYDILIRKRNISIIIYDILESIYIIMKLYNTLDHVTHVNHIFYRNRTQALNFVLYFIKYDF